MNKIPLFEYQNPATMITEVAESVNASGQKQKDLYMKGIFIQGDVRNYNQRIYPVTEIKRAVTAMNTLIESGAPIFGEGDHPTGLNINIDRISHSISSMWMEGANGCGKLKIIPTPMGNIIKTILESGCKLGVSSRGSGNVNESSGYVSDFEIVTVDVVAQPSAPNAFPIPVYEGLRNFRKNGDDVFEMAAEVKSNPKVQRYLKEELTRFINELKLN
jgi:hypothetical protein